MPDTCCKCGKRLHVNETGLAKKIFGRNTMKVMCLNCLTEDLDVTLEDLYDLIIEFQNQGCMLFTPDSQEWQNWCRINRQDSSIPEEGNCTRIDNPGISR